jgi:molybdopterin synthase sulfur carrier subunit
MAIVWIPALMRDLTGGRETLTVSGATVRQVIESLDRSYPGIKDRLCDAHGLRAGISVAVDTEVARFGLSQTVSENSEVHFLPAISGGSLLSSEITHSTRQNTALR